MSAKKRRFKRKLAMLRRLDVTHSRLYLLASPRRDGQRARRLWWACVVPLGDKLSRLDPNVWAALSRGTDGARILMQNYRQRAGLDA